MKVLVTAGATWVKVDEVRILTSVFTGNTGVALAKGFVSRKHEVTLLANPHCLSAFPRNVRVRSFRYFGELRALLEDELCHRHYDVIIHCAAVSDYRVKAPASGKIPSREEGLTLHLVPTQKLIKRIRSLAKDSFLIQFKLEITKEALKKAALESLAHNHSDVVVANAYRDLKKKYRSSIFDKTGFIRDVHGIPELMSSLHRLCLDHFRYIAE